jgi:hypothetical protein
MRGAPALLAVLTLVVLLSGCRSTDPVERELHARDTELREVRDEVDQLMWNNKALQAELNSVRGGGAGPLPGVSDRPAPIYPIRSLTLGRQTGGYDDTNSSGDTALQVVLEPRDADNHSVKVPGSAHIYAVEISPEGLKKALCSWELDPDQLRGSWRQGLLTTGFVLVLPWKAYPSSTKLRVVAQLRLADGRLYEADKDVTVKLVPSAQRKMLPAPEDRPGGAPEDPLLPTPPPEKIQPPIEPPPEKIQAPVIPPPAPVDPGPFLPPPPTPGPGKSATGWGTPAAKSVSAWGNPQPHQPDVPAVAIDKPTPIRSGW